MTQNENKYFLVSKGLIHGNSVKGKTNAVSFFPK